MPVWIANNKKLRDWLRKDGFKKLAVAPGFAFDANVFENAKTEVIRQHEEETDPDHRTAYRLLTKGKPKEKPQATVVYKPDISKWLRVGFGVLVLSLLSVIAARSQTVVFKDEGVTRVRRAGGQVGIDFVGAGVSCSTNVAGITTCTISGGGTTGYDRIQDEGTNLVQRTILNFIGAGVSCVDNVPSTRTDCTISGGGGGSWSDLTAPTAAVNLVADALAELVTFDFQANYTTEQMVLFKTSTGTPSGGTLLTLEVHDPDVLPFAISDGTNTVFQVERDADTTIARPTAGNLVLVLDAGNAGVTDQSILEFQSGGTRQAQLVMDLNAGVDLRITDQVVKRIDFGDAGETQLFSGNTDTGADRHFDFFTTAANQITTLTFRIHGDSDKISWGSAADVSLERTSDPNTVLGLAITAGSVFGLPVISADPNTATWGTGQDGRFWFNSTDNVLKLWDGADTKIIAPSRKETPTGALNGINLVFDFARTIDNTMFRLLWNGLVLEEGASDDYTITGASQITMALAPITGDKLFAYH